MKQKRRFGLLLSAVILVMLLFTAVAQAQDSDTGYITGAVYRDVNADGLCIDTGVEGEDPVEGIPIEFVSSDEATVVTLTTADNGTYGLADAGESYWRVSAKPDAAKYTVHLGKSAICPRIPSRWLGANRL